MKTAQIEIFTPEERLPREGKEIIFKLRSYIYSGFYRNNSFYKDGDYPDSHKISEIKHWYYPPEV